MKKVIRLRMTSHLLRCSMFTLRQILLAGKNPLKRKAAPISTKNMETAFIFHPYIQKTKPSEKNGLNVHFVEYIHTAQKNSTPTFVLQ